jgi:hypothetical protein
MNKICKHEFLNTADNKIWCGVGQRCMGRSTCSSFKDGSSKEQEERFMLKCERCGWAGHPNLEESGPHTKATCGNGECGAYIKMLSKKDLDLLIKDWTEPVPEEPTPDNRLEQMELNFRFLLNHIEVMHTLLCPDKTGTWQDRTQQVLKAVQEITNDR